MSPLVKYYGAIAAFLVILIICLLLGFLTSAPIYDVVVVFGAVFCLLLLVYAYAYVRCSRCAKDLSDRRTFFTHALPGRYCPGCGADLLRDE